MLILQSKEPPTAPAPPSANWKRPPPTGKMTKPALHKTVARIMLTAHEGAPQQQHLLHVLPGGRLKLRQLAGPLVGPVYPAGGLQILLLNDNKCSAADRISSLTTSNCARCCEHLFVCLQQAWMMVNSR